MPTLTRRKEPRIEGRDPYRWLYKSYQWQKFSSNYLKKNRLCKICLEEGRTVIALNVDHVQPLIHFHGNPYDLSNLQPLCKSCHSKKTKQENK